MTKYLKYIVLVLFLIVVIVRYSKNSNVDMKESKEYLQNNIEFEGRILGYEKSNNHAFGVIYLKLLKSNVSQFDKVLEKGIYPYKINGDVAELYCTVSVDRKMGDIVKVVSNNETVYYNPQNSNEEGSIFIIKDFANISFVNTYTKLK